MPRDHCHSLFLSHVQRTRSSTLQALPKARTCPAEAKILRQKPRTWTRALESLNLERNRCLPSSWGLPIIDSDRETSSVCQTVKEVFPYLAGWLIQEVLSVRQIYGATDKACELTWFAGGISSTSLLKLSRTITNESTAVDPVIPWQLLIGLFFTASLHRSTNVQRS